MNSSFGRLLKLAAPFKGWMALAALLGFITVASGIGLMATSSYLISSAGLHPSVAALGVAIVGVRFFGIARGLFRYLERYVSHQVTFKLLARLRVWFYEGLEPLAPARLLQYKYRSGDLLSRVVSDIETLQNFYVRVIAPPVVALLVALMLWFFLGAYDVTLALTLLVFFLAASVGVPWLTYLLSGKLGQEIVAVRAELNTQLVEGIQGMAEIVAFGQEPRQSEKLQKLNHKLTGLQERMAWVGGLQNALGNLLMNLAAWTMLIVAIPLVRDGRLDGVYLAVVVLAALASFEAVLPLPTTFQHLGSSLEAARRLFEIVDAKPAVRDPEISSPTPEDYTITVKNLHFSYPIGDTEPKPETNSSPSPILKGISFEIPQGGCLALVGPSGAGKSTIGNLLLRFWDYSEGEINLGGYDLPQYRQEDLHRLIAVVAQNTHLFNATVYENILLARPTASREEVIEAARQAQLHQFIESLPQGYDTPIGEQGMGLSGGERQRVAIARAILKDAPILLLDEATANLDALTEREVLKALEQLRQGRTTLIITHRLVGLEKVDEILVLRAGKLVERGSHHDLLQLENYYWRMWRSYRDLLTQPILD
jgi:ATP-binding cassette subfamily C protein CydC